MAATNKTNPYAQMRMIEATLAYPEKFNPRLDESRLKKLLEAWKLAADAQTKDACVAALQIYGLTTPPKHQIEAAFLEQLSIYCMTKFEDISNASEKVKKSAKEDQKSIKKDHTEDTMWTMLEEVHKNARKLNSFRRFIVGNPTTEEYFVTIEMDKSDPSYKNDYKLLHDKYNIYYDVSIKPIPD